MSTAKWALGLLVGLLLNTAAVAQANFPEQSYIDEVNAAFAEEVKSQAGTFDEEGLRVIAMNVAIDRPTLGMMMAMGMLVSDAVAADALKVMIDDLRADHFELACSLYGDYLVDYADIDSFNLHFVVVTEDRQPLYDEEQACTIDDIW